MWDPPPTAGVLSLSYHITVTNVNTGAVIINATTATTSYLVGSLQHCTVYTASVTPFSQEHEGNIEVIVANTPGGKLYAWENINKFNIILYIIHYLCKVTIEYLHYSLFMQGYYRILQGSIDVNYDVFNTVTICFKIHLQVKRCLQIKC